jgi:hypothetical protein
MTAQIIDFEKWCERKKKEKIGELLAILNQLRNKRSEQMNGGISSEEKFFAALDRWNRFCEEAKRKQAETETEEDQE